MYMSIFGGEKWKDFHPGGFWGVRKWRILCFISANSPSGVGGRFFARGVRFFELPGIRKGGKKEALFIQSPANAIIGNRCFALTK